MRTWNVCVIAVVVSSSVVAAETPAPKFEAQTIDDKVAIGYGLAIGDVDGDKKPDIILADKTQFRWYRNPGEAGKPWTSHVMAENLTERDNVCVAAADIDGDGKVEVAVGGQWNPGQTSSREESGAVFYLIRPEDPTQRWTPVRIGEHDPTVHRMHWMKVPGRPLAHGRYLLTVLPLHGEGNKQGEGTPVRLQVVTPPAAEELNNPEAKWTSEFIDTGLHMTHNYDVAPFPAPGGGEWLIIGGKEGVKSFWMDPRPRNPRTPGEWKSDFRGVDGENYATGEVRYGRSATKGPYDGIYAMIEPMHGTTVAVHTATFIPDTHKWDVKRVVLDETLKDGHAIVTADFLGIGRDQVAAGWRMPNADRTVGIKLYVPTDAAPGAGAAGQKWATHWIDNGNMATEDMKVADLDGDGKVDIIAAGRATKNLIVYWNRAGK